MGAPPGPTSLSQAARVHQKGGSSESSAATAAGFADPPAPRAILISNTFAVPLAVFARSDSVILIRSPGAGSARRIVDLRLACPHVRLTICPGS